MGTDSLPCKTQIKACATNTLVRLVRCSTESNSTRRITDQFTQSHSMQGLKREKLRIQKNRMIIRDVIEPAQMEQASSTFFVPKRHRTLHFCISYCNLNAGRIQVSYWILRMDECIDSLGEATLFQTCTLTVDNSKSKLLKKVGIKLLLHPIMFIQFYLHAVPIE